MKKLFLLVLSHTLFVIIGFAAGVYTLPILMAPDSPSVAEVDAATGKVEFQGQFRRDLEGSDFFHWGEGTILVGQEYISLKGRIAPGPAYKLYLSPKFVETEAEFGLVKPNMVQVGDINTFENFIVPVPNSIDPRDFNTVIVWCESFDEFITAASYK